MEQWKQISGYDYEVSSYGNVRNMKTGKLKQQHEVNGGYLRVGLYKNGKLKNFRVHRLVANAFIPNPHGYSDVDHIDRNRQNNHVSNLRWLSHKNNVTESDRPKKVRCIETNTIYESIKQASEETGCKMSNISKCCKGERKTTGKLHWEYVIN
jgi:hypothetical protein